MHKVKDLIITFIGNHDRSTALDGLEKVAVEEKEKGKLFKTAS